MKKVFKIGWIVLVLGVIMLGIGYFNNGDKAVYFENNRPAILHLSTKKRALISILNELILQLQQPMW